MIILDNFPSHHSKLTTETATKTQKIDLIFPPPYSPDLKPIEFIWKSIKKKKLSSLFYRKIRRLTRNNRNTASKHSQNPKTYAKEWINKFLNKSIKK